MGNLEWVGDDIGLNPGEDVTVKIRDPLMPGGAWHVSLASALSIVDRLDGRARQRLDQVLPFAAAHGHLSAGDLAAWQEYLTGISPQWVPVVYLRIQHGGGAEACTESVCGEPRDTHRDAMNAARLLCEELDGDGYAARRVCRPSGKAGTSQPPTAPTSFHHA
ncbi:hypothetical protein [Burkholderia glumae]|uniref:Uncharacterized protein n=1 Tax=Burkholderia glumae TaxID=337 RepID=A0AAP9XZK6_BURGL|nr:hypothetical protein [Burkholderia glumae]AJY67359.1 hypothetical protein KS03_904 [Burkholderia glumae LMG 2196 = ATCC 33617]PNL00122.1 hypothetical protein CEQ24_013220 [Burkholderia glumae]QJP73108.1 hypothetical protein HJC54_23945 [Burkholderia glumae]QPQ92022.1 hypothetical protein I6H06_23260 [Burkholderia glumae]QQM89766.1 hypothetical protein I6G78_11375 [Burkholderia glumae]